MLVVIVGAINEMNYVKVCCNFFLNGEDCGRKAPRKWHFGTPAYWKDLNFD